MTRQGQPSPLQGMSLIVKREIGQYFNTWFGYVIIAALLFITGMFYNVMAVGSAPRYSSDVLADFFFYASGCTLTVGILLAMRLIAEERQQGTLPLLTTSPLTEGQIVTAKYFATLLVLGVYVALTIYMPALVYYHGKVSLGHLLAGYFGLMCIGSAGIAIGMFGSTLVKSQLVAAIISAVIAVAMILLWIGNRIIDGPVGDVIANFTLHDKHFRPFMDGIINLENVVFYASVTIFFIFASRNLLEARRWRM